MVPPASLALQDAARSEPIDFCRRTAVGSTTGPRVGKTRCNGRLFRDRYSKLALVGRVAGLSPIPDDVLLPDLIEITSMMRLASEDGSKRLQDVTLERVMPCTWQLDDCETMTWG